MLYYNYGSLKKYNVNDAATLMVVAGRWGDEAVDRVVEGLASGACREVSPRLL